MLSSKKAVFYLLLIVLTVSSINTGNNIYQMFIDGGITGQAVNNAYVFFEVLEGPDGYNISYSFYWLDGSDGRLISGLPVGLNVTALYENGTPVEGMRVEFIEQNGWNTFAPTQYWTGGGVKNYQIAETYTNQYGKVNFTIVPTGGESGQEANIGPYLLNLSFYHNGLKVNSTEITNENRGLPSVNNSGAYDVPFESQVAETRDKLIRYYGIIKDYKDMKGDNFHITIYSNNTDNGTSLNATSGNPAGLYFTILNHTTSNPISGAKVTITEINGWSPFAPTQYWTTEGLTNYMIAESYTDSDGKVNFTVIPTGGESGQESLIGNYNVTLNVTLEDEFLYSTSFDIGRRDIPAESGNEEVPNKAQNSELRDKIIRIYYLIKGWL